METNTGLLELLNDVLGSSKKTSKGNHAFSCPFCGHHKKKLEINLITDENGCNFWHCWVCDTKGGTIKSLFKNLI